MTLPNAGGMNEKLKSDNKPISGWYYDDPGARWIVGPYREYEDETLSPGDSFVFLKAVHDVYYKVTFDLGYEDAENIIKDLENKSEFPVPTDPTREGYTFTGWFDEDGNLVHLEGLPETATRDMTLTAQWEDAESESPKPTDPGIDIEEPDVPLGDEPEGELHQGQGGQLPQRPAHRHPGQQE